MKIIKKILSFALIIVSLFSINLFAVENNSLNKIIQNGNTLKLDIENGMDIFNNNSFIVKKRINSEYKNFEVELHKNIELYCLNCKSTNVCVIKFNGLTYGIDIKTKNDIDRIINSDETHSLSYIEDTKNNIGMLIKDNRTISIYKPIQDLNVFIEYSLSINEEKASVDKDVVNAVKRISITNKEPFNISEKYTKLEIKNFGIIDIKDVSSISKGSITVDIPYKDTSAQLSINYGDNYGKDIFEDKEKILLSNTTEKGDEYFIKTVDKMGISEFGFTDSNFTIRGYTFQLVVDYMFNHMTKI